MIRSFAILAYLLACTGGSEVETPAPTDQAAVEPAPEPETPSEGLVVGKTTLRKAATDEKKIDDGAGKMVSNYVTSLHRGEKVSVLGTDGDWTEVKVSDGTEGWLKTDRLVVLGPDTRVATLMAEGKVFARPDLLALEADKKLEPGALLFVLQTKDQFAEVDYPRSSVSSSKAWTLANDLVADANEVEAAKVIAKVKQLRADNDSAAAQMEELARSQFGSSKLITLLDPPAGEVPPEGAAPEGAAPEGAAPAGTAPEAPPVQ